MERYQKIAIASVLLVCLILSIVAISLAVDCKNHNINVNDENDSSNLAITTITEDLLSLKVVNSVSSNGLPSKDITAEVLPVNAVNKKINWTLNWKEGASLINEDVSTYIKLTVKSENVCNVQCIKAFPKNEIIINAKTDIGDASASCVVNYVGIPDSITVSGSHNVMTNNSYGVSFNALVPGQTYDYDITFDNALNCVTDDYDPTHVLGAANQYWNHLTYKLSGQGRYEYCASDDETGDSYEINPETYITSEDLREFISVSVTRNKLSITVLKSFSEGSQVFEERPYVKFLDGKTPYFSIQVFDKDHPDVVSNKINFSPVVVANNINLSDSKMTF